MRFVLDAMQLVIGYPALARVDASGPGSVTLFYEAGAVGISLASGERQAAATAEPSERPIYFPVTNRIAKAVWKVTAEPLELWLGDAVLFSDGEGERRFDGLIAADDRRALCATLQRFTLLDAPANEVRWLGVPEALSPEDPVTGGIQGSMDSRAFFVAPDFVVVARTPALLVVRASALEAALRSETVEWNLVTKLPLADPRASAPARSTRTGIVIDRFVSPEPIVDAVRVRGWLWPPAGWAFVDSRNGQVSALRRLPVGRTSLEVVVHCTPLRRTAVPRVGWPKLPALPSSGDPPVGFESLSSVLPVKTRRGAIRLARTLGLDARNGAYGPLGSDIFENLAVLGDEDADNREETTTELFSSILLHQGSVFDGTAYAFLPLCGILLDPKSAARDTLALHLASLLDAARTRLLGEHVANETAAAEAIRYAVRRALPLLVAGPPKAEGAPEEEARVWNAWRVLLVLAAALEAEPPDWIGRLASADPALAALHEAAALPEGLADLVEGLADLVAT